MPGFNQRGPMNDGPRTGRRQGECTGTFGGRQGSGNEGSNTGRRCRRSGGNGRGMGMGYNQGSAENQWFSNDKGNLQNHAEMLEKELMAVKSQIKDLDEVQE